MRCNNRRTNVLKRILAIMMLTGMLGSLAGCNTMHGLGQDIEKGGENMQRKSDESRRN